MSYDLYFIPHNSDKSTSADDLLAYFNDRSNYQLEGSQAIYQNEDTGVYFTFEKCEPPIAVEENIANRIPHNILPFTFNMNFYRPHVFALEADIELRSFIRHFDLFIYDPQGDQGGATEYSTEIFLKGWNSGNEMGYIALLSRPEEAVYSLPSSEIERCWKWNYNRQKLETEIPEDVFVPKIVFALFNKSIVKVIVWGDGIPIAIPKVNFILAPRQELAPGFFKKSEDTVYFEWSEVQPIIKDFPFIDDKNGGYFKLYYEDYPKSILNLFKSKKATDLPFQSLIAADSILNRELIMKYRKT